MRRRLLGDFSALYYVLDVLLLLLPLIVVGPPRRSFVLALQPQVLACFTLTLAFVTLLSSKAACEATYNASISRSNKTTIKVSKRT